MTGSAPCGILEATDGVDDRHDHVHEDAAADETASEAALNASPILFPFDKVVCPHEILRVHQRHVITNASQEHAESQSYFEDPTSGMNPISALQNSIPAGQGGRSGATCTLPWFPGVDQTTEEP